MAETFHVDYILHQIEKNSNLKKIYIPIGSIIEGVDVEREGQIKNYFKLFLQTTNRVDSNRVTIIETQELRDYKRALWGGFWIYILPALKELKEIDFFDKEEEIQYSFRWIEEVQLHRLFKYGYVDIFEIKTGIRERLFSEEKDCLKNIELNKRYLLKFCNIIIEDDFIIKISKATPQNKITVGFFEYMFLFSKVA